MKFEHFKDGLTGAVIFGLAVLCLFLSSEIYSANNTIAQQEVILEVWENQSIELGVATDDLLILTKELLSDYKELYVMYQDLSLEFENYKLNNSHIASRIYIDYLEDGHLFKHNVLGGYN